MLQTILRRRLLLLPPAARRLAHPRHFISQIHHCPPTTTTTSLAAFSPPDRYLWNSIELLHRRFSSAEQNPSCWNCEAQPKGLLFLVCDTCRAIQPLDPSVDYFQIFGLEKKYEIEDVGNLNAKYKDWQKKLHPDLVHSKSQEEREFAAEQSARVIEAYRTLTHPLSRAIYVLRLEGVDVNEEETVSEPELLAEIMEIREAVEEAPDSEALNEIQSLIQQKLQQWSNSFAKAFHSRNFGEALTCIQRMTYYERVNEEIVKRL